jgi:hypothetical protein
LWNKVFRQGIKLLIERRRSIELRFERRGSRMDGF